MTPYLKNSTSERVMTYLNIHTHHPLPADEKTVPSVGLHPWHLTEEWSAQFDAVRQQAEAFPKETFFIGECGLDRLCSTPYTLQIAAFKAHIALSEELHRPLMLHCVHALEDVVRLKKGSSQPWVFHGFRGKPQQLQQLLSHGFYVSFGFRHNVASLSACPTCRLFLETDDVAAPIAPLYASAATILKLPVEVLCGQLWENMERMQN